MMIRRCARVVCILVLTVTSAPLSASAVDLVADGKSKRTAKAATDADAADAAARKVPPARINLVRDLANKLVRPVAMEFKAQPLSDAARIDYFLVYFGAHWCPNCKKLTPKLTDFYNQQRARHDNFEIIFVSADKDERAMLQFMKGYKMPWPALKFGEHKQIASLKALAGRGYPCIAIVDARGNLLAHSYGEDRAGTYVEPLKLVEKLAELLDETKATTATKSVAGAGR